MPAPEIGPIDPRTPEVVALIRAHLEFANTHSPPEDVHALDLDALTTDDISFYGASVGGRIVGMGGYPGARLAARRVEVDAHSC